MSGLPAQLSNLSRDRLDVSTAILGLAVAVALLPLGFMTSEILVTGIPVALGIGCLGYLLSVDNSQQLALPAVDLPGRTALPKLATVGMSGMVLIAAFTGGRPLPFLLLAGAVGTLLLAHIAFAEADVLDNRSVLVTIVAYAAVVRFAALFTTPGFIGIDTWTHVTSYAAAIQGSGSLAALSGIKYSTTPFYHLIAVSGAELLGISLRNAVYLTVGVLMPLTVLAVYGAARYVTGVRWALFAALLFGVSEYVVEWGLVVSTTSLGLGLFLVAFLLLARILYTDAARTDYLVLFGVCAAITLTHQLSAFVTLTVLGTATAVTLFNSRFGRDRRPMGGRTAVTGKYLAPTFVAYLAFTLSIWAITPWRGQNLLSRGIFLAQRWLNERVGFLNITDTTGRGVSGSEATGLAAEVAPLVGNLGFLLMLLVTVIGCLVLLNRDRSTGSLTVIATVGLMAVISLGLPLFGFELLIPKRWFAFMFAPMAIVGALGIGHMMRQSPSRAVLACLFVFMLAFPGAMVTAEKATVDQPTFSEQWTQYSYSESELAAVGTIHETTSASTQPIYTDHPYYRVFERLNQDPAERRAADGLSRAYMMPLGEDGEVSSRHSPVVYRNYQSEGRPVFGGPGETSISQHLSQGDVCSASRNQVYATDGVRMCTSPGA